jgi:hypothetical protein
VHETKLIKEHARKELISQAEVIDDEEQGKWEAEDERKEKAAQLRWDTDASFDQPAEKKEKGKRTEQGRRETTIKAVKTCTDESQRNNER